MTDTNVDHIRVYQDTAGEYRWSAVAANNEIVAEGESHTRPEDAIRAAHGILGDDIRVLDETVK